MIPEDTYISYLPHRLIRVLDTDLAVLAATIADMCSHTEDGTKEISLEYLSTIHGISKRTLQRQLQKLQQLQVIVYDSGLGKGNYGKFLKGDNFDTFCGIKGDKNGTLSENQKVTKIVIKGDKNGTLINKDIITGGDAHAYARTPETSPQEKLINVMQGDTPCDPRKNTKRMNDSNKFPFDTFWAAFKPASEFDYERESCERQWSLMSDMLREDILKTLRNCKRHKPNPHWFLHDYKPELKPEITVFRNGEASLSQAMKEAERGGRAIAYVEAGARLHVPDNFAYVYLSDAQKLGLTIRWTVPKNAQQI